MSEVRQIQKALAGAEDLLLGQGTVIQLRNGVQLVITKLNADLIPYSGDVETGDFVSVKTALDGTVSQTAPDGAMIVPAGTTAQRPVVAYDGYTRYNTTLDVLEAYSEATISWYSVGTNINAATATKLQTARLINGIPFDGTTDIDLGTYTETEVDAGFVAKTAADGAANMPSGTTAQRPVTPVTGMMRWNTTTSVFESYTGAAWQTVGGEPLATEILAGKAELATQAEVDTGTDDNRIVTPLKLEGKLASSTTTSKAWAAFNGAGTPAILDSLNVSSITDNAVGDFTLNFATALADTNYAATGNSGSSADIYWKLVPIIGGILTTSVRVKTGYVTPSNNADADSTYNTVHTFGG